MTTQSQIAQALNIDIKDSRIESIEEAFHTAASVQKQINRDNTKDAHEIKKDLQELISHFDKIQAKLDRTSQNEKQLYDQYCFISNKASDMNLTQKKRSNHQQSGFDSVIHELKAGLTYYHDKLKGGKPKDYTHTDALVILIEAIHSNFPNVKLSASESSTLTKVLSVYYSVMHSDETSLKDRIKKAVAAYTK